MSFSIIHWRDYNKLEFLQCACKFTELNWGEGNENEESSKRKKVKRLIASLAKDDPQIENNIFRSVENVNLATIIAYKDKLGKEHNFKEYY